MSISAQGFAKLHSNKIKSGYQKNIINFLSWKANDEGIVWWSLKKIAKELLMDIKTVRKWIRKSIEDGILALKSLSFGRTKSTRAYQFISNKEGVQILEGVPKTDFGRGTKNGLFSAAYNRMKKQLFKKQKEDPFAPSINFFALTKRNSPQENSMASKFAYKDLAAVKKMNTEVVVDDTLREYQNAIYKKTNIEVRALELIITPRAVDLFNENLDPSKFVDYFVYYINKCALTVYKPSEKGFIGFISREDDQNWLRDDVLPALPAKTTVYENMTPKMKEAYGMACDRRKGRELYVDGPMWHIGEHLFDLMDQEHREIKEHNYFEFCLHREIRNLLKNILLLPENAHFIYEELLDKYHVQPA